MIFLSMSMLFCLSACRKQERISVGCQPSACFIMNKFQHVRGEGSLRNEVRGRRLEGRRVLVW